jgi:hypothetical protein
VDFQAGKCYVARKEKAMSKRPQTATAIIIRQMAEEHHVSYALTQSDALALDISRHSGDDVLDDIEQLLIALQRAGHLTSRDVMRLQASYLREAKP